MSTVHCWSMDLGNPLEILVHYLLTRGMPCLNHWDEIPKVSALVCMVTHWTGHMMNHNKRLSECHDLLSYYVAWTFTLERILSLC